SELESAASGRGAPLDAATRARFLQLPPLSARVRELAREVTAGTRGARDAAEALTSHLAGRYRYTRVLRRTTALDPVEEFLFVQRSGNCEYFAASLAIMLRTLGIPARVVNGFQRGEWNPYGRHFIVRLLDARAWLDAPVHAAWETLAPSPRGARVAALRARAPRLARASPCACRPAGARRARGRAARLPPSSPGARCRRAGRAAEILRAGALDTRAPRAPPTRRGNGARVRAAG